MSHVFRQKYFSCVCVLCIKIENTVFSMFCNPTEWRMVEFNRNLILRSVGWQKCSAGGLREVMSIFMFMLNYDLIIKSTHLFRWFWVIHYDCHKIEKCDNCRYSGSGQPEYVITPDELRTIRQKKLYPFFDKGGGGDNVGDYQKVGAAKLCLDVTRS